MRADSSHPGQWKGLSPKAVPCLIPGYGYTVNVEYSGGYFPLTPISIAPFNDPPIFGRKKMVSVLPCVAKS